MAIIDNMKIITIQLETYSFKLIEKYHILRKFIISNFHFTKLLHSEFLANLPSK